MKNKKQIISLVLGVLVLGSAGSASADTQVQTSLRGGFSLGRPEMGMMRENDRNQERDRDQRGMGMMTRPVLVGKITAISGNTLTVSSQGFDRKASTTAQTFTVDVSNATILKAGATTTVANLTINEEVLVNGTLSGTNVTATTVRVGGPRGEPGMMGVFKGDGNPVVGGKVTAVSGNTVTITNDANITYAVDVTNAVIVKNGATSTVSSLLVDDRIMVQGTVSGTNITATHVVDNMSRMNNRSDDNNRNENQGFFGRVKGFFGKLFGF